MALATGAFLCALDLRNGMVSPSYVARDAAAGAWRRGSLWGEGRDDGIMSAVICGLAVCPCAVFARMCVLLVVFGLVVGLGG